MCRVKSGRDVTESHGNDRSDEMKYSDPNASAHEVETKREDDLDHLQSDRDQTADDDENGMKQQVAVGKVFDLPRDDLASNSLDRVGQLVVVVHSIDELRLELIGLQRSVSHKRLEKRIHTSVSHGA